MRTKPFVMLSSVVAASVGCGLFGPDPALSHAFAMIGLGPADGPVPIIVLAHDPIDCAKPSFPYVAMNFGESGQLSARTWDIAADVTPSVSYVTWPGKSEAPISGTVTVTSVDNSKVEGSVDLQFPSRTVTKPFSALWVQPCR